jgi:hypothetical protein
MSSPMATTVVPSVQEMTRSLLDKFHAHPGLNVCSLVIHQCPGGLCIEGHVELVDPNVNLVALLAEAETTTPILNRLMVTKPFAVSTAFEI